MSVTEILREEHEGILIMLDVLGELEGLGREDELRREEAMRAVDFFSTFADRCHHGKEEKHLFPALAASGVRVKDGPIGTMLSEHERGREFIKEMTAALRASGPAAGKNFATAARGYRDLLAAHIGKENQVLFPLAERVLTEDHKLRLLQAFEDIERNEMGEGTHERYHAMIEEMAARYLGYRGDGCGSR